jgi:hypothetical protein
MTKTRRLGLTLQVALQAMLLMATMAEEERSVLTRAFHYRILNPLRATMANGNSNSNWDSVSVRSFKITRTNMTSIIPVTLATTAVNKVEAS